MNKINEVFKRLKSENKKAFIPYITCGDPSLMITEDLVKGLSDAGADIIELGIPFSDPLADGPTIQRAILRSLSKGCTVKKVFTMVNKVKKEIIVPIVYMTYYNVIFNYGVQKFVKDAKKYGASGVIVPDLPIEEASELIRAGRKEDFCVIQLVSPTTSLERFKKIEKLSTGFIYYVSLTGVTGTRKTFPLEIKKRVNTFKKNTTKPICVGFGVSDNKQAEKMSSFSDGVIVGSAIIKIIEKNINNKNQILKKVKSFASSLGNVVHR